MSDPSVLVRLSEVSRHFESLNGSTPLYILKNVSLEIRSGESLAIVGPSGSGKSTLLNLIGTLDSPSSGKVFLAGQDLSALNEVQLAQVRNEEIGFIFQSHHLLPQCTVFENVLVPTLVSKKRESRQDTQARAKRLLDRVGLGSRLEHQPGQLSGGERQRVAVVRALINQPKLLLADEPTGALDRASAQNLARLLVELNREEGVTLVVVTHASDLASLMGRALELRDGTLIDLPDRREPQH